ncbi:MAG: Ig-like domain-containing protein [Acidobacteria bacterium]|nr:Ig-like domain-containing protein [Acidobacteriota bacterium]
MAPGKIVFVAVTLLFVLLVCGAGSSAPPRVIATFPANGAPDVDPSTPEIWVKFDRPMMDNSWSWCYEKRSQFPDQTAGPRYEENGTKCILPVRLEPRKEYVIWINMANHANFKDRSGTPAEPYKFTFTTR